MITAGIKDVKNNLSHFLSHVRNGEEILITDRGKPIARIVKEKQGERSIHEVLRPLIDRGLVALPSRRIPKKPFAPVKTDGKYVSEMVIEDRR